VRPRDLLTWKHYFYRVLLPALGCLGPESADTVLSALGRLSVRLWPPRRARLSTALATAGLDLRGSASTLAEGALRFLARDYLLETRDDARALARFDVTGQDELDEAVRSGRGVVLVGSHFGGHLAALHWLYRRDVPLRLMVQRPRHVSDALATFFDRDEGGTDPQSGYFLRRSLNPAECIARLVRARAALRSGMAVYLPGDIPWSGPNTRTGRLLGRPQRLLSVWADLAALTGAPVFYVFCNHLPDGRFALCFEPAGRLRPGQESDAVARYLERLERAIASSPADAAAHLLWPCYGPPCPSPANKANARPSRRVAVAPH
jgi:lauroyl/myristoyl acyltransferase